MPHLDTSSILVPATTEIEHVARALAVQNFLMIAPGEGNAPNLVWVAQEVEMGWTEFRLQAQVAIDAIDSWRAKS